jgi:hypothetical protein
VDVPPGTGERNALRGYRWQYDQLASIVYDSLINQTFVSLRLTDPMAGKVDDLVLMTTAGSAGHQFKSEEPAGAITFNDLLKPRRTRSGQPAPSWLRALADGWLALGGAAGGARVALVTNQWPSVHDHVTTPADAGRLTADNLATFNAQVLAPVSRGELALGDVPAGWAGPIERMRTECGLDPELFEAFLRALELDLAKRDPLGTPDLVRRGDIRDLSDALYRKVSTADDVVVLDRDGVLEAVGWAERVRLRSTHEFPVDLDTYEPLEAASNALVIMLNDTNQGYLAVVGPPGSGKSTLLTVSLTGSDDRIIRYYAYVPGPGTTRTRMEGHGFLHDVVLLLERATNSRGHLLERSDHELRQAFVALLDTVALDYQQTGRRTVILVDGLDHVERDRPGTDSLLYELPRPEEIPNGVVFLVGTRTLTPLRPEARQHVEDQARLLNLDEHRLPHPAVLAICQRVGATADLGREVHERVAQLAAGHPLSLGYLLNKLADATSADQALRLLAEHTQYDGDVAQLYRAIWESLNSQPESQELLAIVSRLRISFTIDDLQGWFEPATVRTFRDHLAYLFRSVGRSRTIFHDSFRQFVTAQSNPTDLPKADPHWDAAYHQRIASLCQNATRPIVRWEGLYHRHRSGQDVLGLASQSLFRAQVTAMRSSATIREDLAIVMRAASDRRDLLAFVETALAKSEAESRWSALEDVDVPGAFLNAELASEAIEYSGFDQGRRIPLPQAYRLSARLGLSGNPEGRRVFDAVEPALFDDADFRAYAGHQNDVYYDWAYAAPMYRRLPKVLDVASKLHPGDRPGEDEFGRGRGEGVVRFSQVANRIVDCLAALGRHAELSSVDQLMARMLMQHHSDPDDEDDGPFHLVDCRLRILERQVAAAPDEQTVIAIVNEGLAMAASVPLYLESLLTWADLALQFDRMSDAEALLRRSQLDAQLEPGDLGYSAGGTLTQRFRYWRLRHRILRKSEPDRAQSVLESLPPDPSTPAGNSISPSAPVYGDLDAIALTRRYDTAVRTLAAAAAATDEDTPYDTARLTATIVPMLDIRPQGRHGSATLSGISTHRGELLRLVIDVVLGHSPDSAVALASRIGSRINEEPERWPLTLQLSIARRLHHGGITPDWYPSALAEAEAEITSGDLDLNSRLERAVELTRHHATLGSIDEAQRLARALPRLSFGVGYRKDDQFDEWVGWLRRATEAGLPDPIDNAIALGHLLTAAAPMTEGAPREAATELPPILAARHPGAAVALFEYLVRKGTVRHLTALAKLTTGLCAALGPGQEAAIIATVDLVTDILARGSTVAYPDAAKAVAAASRSHLGPARGDELIEEMRSRVERDALPTTRVDWLEALGVPRVQTPERDNESSDGWGSLDLTDGTHLTPSAANARIVDAASLIALREVATPASTFGWSKAIRRLTFTPEELARLGSLFPGGNPRGDGDLQIALGHHWLHHGYAEAALACAAVALETADENSWGYMWGTTRRDAHRLAIKAGGDAERHRAWRDLAEGASDSAWRADIILRELDTIVEMLDPTVSPAEIWPLIRTHLDGMAANLELDAEDPLARQPIRWWFPGPSAGIERLHADDSAARAVAVLVTDHATHLQWLLRDPAIAIAANGLRGGFVELEAAIETVLVAEPADDVVEALARAVNASAVGPPGSPTLRRIHTMLGRHANQFIRDLSDSPDTSYVPLPGRYMLALPGGGAPVIGAADLKLATYESVVRMCAAAAGLDEDTVVEHGVSMMRQRRDELPPDGEARAALNEANVNFLFPYLYIFTARSVAGRIVHDFQAARRLSNLSTSDARLLRSFDPALIGLRPGPRPALTPPPPPAGHDTTLERWIAGTSDRLDQYVAALEAAGGYVVAAKAQATVLNWINAEEEFVCSTIIGKWTESGQPSARPSNVYNHVKADLSATVPGREPQDGYSLAIENVAFMFHQLEADWISFSPAMAAHLRWTPRVAEPGVWETSDGQMAVHTIEWVDGWPGHGDRAFDDTEGAGMIVLVTPIGARELASRLAPLTRVSRLNRWGRDGAGSPEAADRQVAHRTEPVDLTNRGWESDQRTGI